MAIKNAKIRKPDSPYEIWNAGDWEWRVLKFYNNDTSEPYSRVFCQVASPYATEMGDVYYDEIRSQATLTYRDPDMA